MASHSENAREGALRADALQTYQNNKAAIQGAVLTAIRSNTSSICDHAKLYASVDLSGFDNSQVIYLIDSAIGDLIHSNIITKKKSRTSVGYYYKINNNKK